MLGVERRQRVMEMLTHDGKVYVGKLAEVFRVIEDHPPRPRKDMTRAEITAEMRIRRIRRRGRRCRSRDAAL